MKNKIVINNVIANGNRYLGTLYSPKIVKIK